MLRYCTFFSIHWLIARCCTGIVNLMKRSAQSRQLPQASSRSCRKGWSLPKPACSLWAVAVNASMWHAAHHWNGRTLRAGARCQLPDDAVGIQRLIDPRAWFRELRLISRNGEWHCWQIHVLLRTFFSEHRTKIIKRNVYRCKIRHMFFNWSSVSPEKNRSQGGGHTHTN